jgi:hypothetical protein
MAIYHAPQLRHFLVRALEKFIEQAKLMHQFQSGRMNRIAAEIAQKISMFFQDAYLNACARKQKSKHHSSWAAAGDYAAFPQLR